MPIYVYSCESCGSHYEKRQSFSDAPLTVCESCGGKLRKLIQPAPVIFKGSGWYATDSRSPSGLNGRNGHNGSDNGKASSETPATEKAATPAAETAAPAAAANKD